MTVSSKYYETDLVTTENIFDIISLADYLIMESLYKIEFYYYTLQLNVIDNKTPTLEVNKEIERIIEMITKNESYNSIFVNLYNFVRQDFDNNYQLFLSELLAGRYAILGYNNILTTVIDYKNDVEGRLVECRLQDPEGRRYFHMIHSHAKFMETKDRIEKEKNQSMKAMMDQLGAVTKPPKNLSVDIFAIPPPSPEDQKMVQDMFRKMMEETMKHRDSNIKKMAEYEQLKKDNTKRKSIFDSAAEDDIDDFLDENDEYDTFEIDENDGR